MNSLRVRLVAGVVLVLAVVLAIAGVVVARYVDSTERDALDDRLVRTAELSRVTAVNAVVQELPRADKRLDAVLAAADLALRLQLGKVTLLDAGDPLPHPPANAPTGLSTFERGGRPYRVYVETLRGTGLGRLARLEVTASLQAVDQRQHALTRRLVLLGLVALLVAGAGVALAGELVLGPLRRLRAVTASVAGDEDLDRRVPADRGPTEVRALAASFNAMLARLGASAAARERALAATRRFAADAGHELRTPLTTVQAAISALRRHPDMSAQQRDALLADADAEQARLVELIDGLQALARGDAAPTERAAVDLTLLAAAATDDAHQRHPDATIALDAPDGPVVVQGWEPGLRAAIDNLVENALRHGGKRVTVTVAPGLVRVDDDGPGIPQAERERLLAPFARAAGPDVPGSGLGLALVDQQARLHGATLAIDDAPGGGARVELRLR